MAFAVSGPPARCSYRPRLPDARAPDSSSHALADPSRVSRATTRPALMSGQPSLGFRPSSRHKAVESTLAGIPSPLSSVLDVSHVLDGFLLHSLRGFISPRNHVQGSLFRGFPQREAVRARHPPLPSCRWPEIPAIGCPTAPGPRAPPSGSCSSRRSVAARQRFRLARRSIPS